MDSLILFSLLLFSFKVIFYLLLNIVIILSTLLTKVITSISLCVFSLVVSLFVWYQSVFLRHVHISKNSGKNKATKIKRVKLAIALVFFL